VSKRLKKLAGVTRFVRRAFARLGPSYRFLPFNPGVVAAARSLLPLNRRKGILPDNQPSQVKEWCDVDFQRCSSLKLQKPDASNLLPEPLLLVAGKQ